MAGPVIKIAIVGDASSASRAFSKTEKEAKSFGKKTTGILKNAGSVALGVYGPQAVAGIFNFFKTGIQGAADDEAAQTSLHDTLRRTAHATRDQMKAVDDWVSSTQNATGTLDDELRPALEAMLRAGDNVAQAQRHVALAQDIATKTGKPLSAVSAAVAKATTGQFTALNKLDPSLKKVIKGGGNTHDVFKKLQGTFGGATKTFAETTTKGKFKVLSAQFTDLKEKIGEKLLPILVKLGDWMLDHKPVMVAFAAVVGTALVAAFISWAVAAAAAAAATLAAAWPVLAVLAAIALLVIGILWLKDNWRKVWEKIKEAAAAVFDWVKRNWPLLLGILTGPIGLAVLLIVKHWDKIKDAFTAVKRWIGDRITDIVDFFKDMPGRIGRVMSGAFDSLKDAFGSVKRWLGDRIDDVVGWFKDMPGRIGRVIGGLFDGVKDAFKSAINWVIDKWNGFSLRVDTHIPGVGKIGFDTPDIPRLHSGGVFNSGRGEGLALLKDGETIFTPAQMRALNGGSGSGNVYINLPAGADPAAVVRAQKAWQRRNGRAA